MDFLDPKKQRAHDIRLFVGYILIGLIVFILTGLLVLQSYGYGLDRKTGSIIQNGLLFVSAQPEQADVYLNGELTKSQSDARLVLPAGDYSLELKRTGYRSWNRSFELAGGTIERMVYPFLFPEKLDPKDQQLYGSVPTFATESPDRHWILVLQPGKSDSFDVFDTTNPKAPAAVISLPAGLLTAGTNSQLKLVEWSTDNRHVLVEHTFSGGHEFIIIDRENPASSLSVNKVLGRNPSKVTLRNKQFDHVHLYEEAAQKLDFGDLKAATITPVLTDVLAYKTHGDDMILYASGKDASAGKTRIMLKDAGGSYLLREVAADPVYLLELARYDGSWYVAAGSKAEGRAYVYKNPLEYIKRPETLASLFVQATIRTDEPTHIAFSANTQFIMIQGGSKFSVYDVENKRSYRYDIGVPIDGNEYARWMDGHRMTVTSGGKLVVFDYDGINKQTLNANQPGIVPFFDRDYKLLFNVAPSASVQNRAALTMTNLKVAPVGQ